jgi:hypothetical protein
MLVTMKFERDVIQNKFICDSKQDNATGDPDSTKVEQAPALRTLTKVPAEVHPQASLLEYPKDPTSIATLRHFSAAVAFGWILRSSGKLFAFAGARGGGKFYQ